jgi:hypothetical protein
MAKRNRKTFESVQRDKRIYDQRLAGKTAMQIAVAEHVDISTVHRVLKAASTLTESQQALATHNYGRLEDIIQTNYPAMQGRDHDATNAVIRAIEAQNKMLGIGAGGTTINIGGEEAARGINFQLPRGIDFVKPKEAPPDEPGHVYSGKVLQYPRLVEATANEPEPANTTDVVKVPPDQIGRPGFPKGMTEAPSDPMRPARADPPIGDINDRSFRAIEPTGPKTELDIPKQGFGYHDSSAFPPPKIK